MPGSDLIEGAVYALVPVFCVLAAVLAGQIQQQRADERQRPAADEPKPRRAPQWARPTPGDGRHRKGDQS